MQSVMMATNQKAKKATYDRARRQRLGQTWIDHSAEWIKNNREKHREYCKKSYYNRHEHNKARGIIYHRRIRREALDAYGGICACCGETIFEFLSIDHVEGKGNIHRAEVGRGNAFYNWLKKNNYPPGFQVLCHNCNQAKGNFGECPHKLLKL